jgi:hypothetical protein
VSTETPEPKRELTWTRAFLGAGLAALTGLLVYVVCALIGGESTTTTAVACSLTVLAVLFGDRPIDRAADQIADVLGRMFGKDQT